MDDIDLNIDELKKDIGKRGETFRVEIEKGLIRQVVDAVGDPNPLWQDPEYAQGHRFRGLVAPPWILFAALFARLEHDSRPRVQTPFKRTVDGGGKWEFYQSLRPGDTITVETKLSDVYVQKGKTGIKLFEVIETHWFNQHGALVGKNVNTLISY